jgi:hypothetical protein
MRWVLTVLGVLVVLVGGMFTLQGVGILPGSFMSGQMQWAINGTITMIVGAGLIVFANWPRKKSPPSIK